MAKHSVIDHSSDNDGIDRRGFLKCMAWAGTGMLWVASGGILRSYGLSQIIDSQSGSLKQGVHLSPNDFAFAQISDSHIGFDKAANSDVVATLQAAVSKINALTDPPAFLLHTGDLSHLSKVSEFDILDQVLKDSKTSKVYFVPGEHDVFTDNGKQYLQRYGKGSKGGGWYSFDFRGTHFVGLVNVLNLKPGGLGTLGQEQLDWLKKDVKGYTDSTPIVIFAHVPLWAVYPSWGWGTDDAGQALSYMRRFGSVTVLNGHIHQTLQKVEGNITFHTAMSTAFPQPAPGSAPSPGPMKVPADRLRSLLGVTSVHFVRNHHSLAVIDMPLAANAQPSSEPEESSHEVKRDSSPNGSHLVVIDNFSFEPKSMVVEPGSTVTWVNHDDTPHTVVSTDKEFASPALDTDEQFSHVFSHAGTYDYYCSIHQRMTGTIDVR